ncbi:MAG: hypothetical protein GTN62_15345 [Gemmatimonadales bacterium]|nr:hypothetical protein [Gemmatimonadales bacterium]NIN13187.1 hypothetical protein [Gemmatimonadales bacterium]NIN51465.1 hypothetical protein [Gemmatimonadales bacterium]NIP08929.1 hypothetical protein [Gemmatimonadales bacterium]NIR03717.1 hypothetical protein [Gemmatimonadales bacterium]
MADRGVRRICSARSTALAGLLVIAASGCSDPFGGAGLEVTLWFSHTEVGPHAPVIVTVTATNLGDSVVWGQGSSSCQLGAIVQVGSEEHRIDLRICTADLAPQGLGPNESRTEEWIWTGEVLVGNSVVTLTAGEYQVQALAGEVKRSDPRTIRVLPVSSE